MSRKVGHQSPSVAASHHRRMKTKAYTLNLPLCQGVGCDLIWIKFCKTVVITTKLSSGLFNWRDYFLWNAFISTASLLILRNDNTAHQLFTSLFDNIYEIGWFLPRYHNHYSGSQKSCSTQLSVVPCCHVYEWTQSPLPVQFKHYLKYLHKNDWQTPTSALQIQQYISL